MNYPTYQLFLFLPIRYRAIDVLAFKIQPKIGIDLRVVVEVSVYYVLFRHSPFDLVYYTGSGYVEKY